LICLAICLVWIGFSFSYNVSIKSLVSSGTIFRLFN
jgi:hypothetical protein